MKRLYYLPLLFLFIFPVSTKAQFFDVGVGGGLTMMQNDTYKNFNMETGFHIGLKAKLNLPLIPITPVGFLNYHFLSGEFLGTDLKQNIFQIGAGGEFSLLPGPVSPYLALDVAMNNFGAFDGVPGSESVSRVGLALGAGVQLGGLIPINLDASLKYHLMNLMGKEDGEESIGAIMFNVFFLF
jgi:opacity protein-like surface antigen